MSNVEPRIVFATDIFIREMKRQWFRQHPSADPFDCPIRILEDYPMHHRISLVASIGAAIEASAGMTEVYAAWIKMKTEGQPAG